MDADRLRELFLYNPLSGIFVHKAKKKGVHIGSVAGSLSKRYGYIIVGVDATTYPAHRLAWLYMTGSWPKDQIDHINGNRSDNRFENLREATNQQNAQNKPAKGYCWLEERKAFRVYVNVGKKQIYLGYRRTEKEAHDLHVEGCIRYKGNQFLERRIPHACTQ